MEQNRDSPPDPKTKPRRFVYRTAEPDSDAAHPLRRTTDTPRSFQGRAGQLSPKPMLLKFRVYLKLN
jgi:hypothetical protein